MDSLTQGEFLLEGNHVESNRPLQAPPVGRRSTRNLAPRLLAEGEARKTMNGKESGVWAWAGRFLKEEAQPSPAQPSLAQQQQ